MQVVYDNFEIAHKTYSISVWGAGPLFKQGIKFFCMVFLE